MNKYKIQSVTGSLSTKNAFCIALLLLICMQKAIAGNLKLVQNYNTRAPFSFQENKGQLADENGKLLPDILYFGKDKSVNTYCFKDKIAFVFMKSSRKAAPKAPKRDFKRNFDSSSKGGDTITAARMEMQFVNTNPAVQIIADEPLAYYENYYLAHCHNGVTAHTFNKLTYKNIYPYIDLVLEAKGKGMEYSFIVYPGGDAGNIRIHWNGTDSLQQQESSIRYANSLGQITESNLNSYLQNGQEVGSSYKVQSRTVSYEIGNYDKGRVLVIDPELVWATYFGGSGNDYEYDMTGDHQGNIEIAGSTTSHSGIATTGAFSGTYVGAQDGFLSKFSGNGKLLWSTYLGSGGYDQIWAIATDNSNNILFNAYLFNKSENLATKGIKNRYTTDLVGKFSPGGTLLWSTYFGGDHGTRIFDISSDSGNVFITGVTESDSGLATSGAYLTKPSTNLTAFLAKYSSDGDLLWSTYFGGSDVNIGYYVVNDPNGNAYIAGWTVSKTGIATPGAYQTSINAQEAAFLTKFSTSGKLIWSTYCASSKYSFPDQLAVDRDSNLYLAADTSGNVGLSIHIIQKFSANGKSQWIISKSDINFFVTNGKNIYAFETDSSHHTTEVIDITGNKFIHTGMYLPPYPGSISGIFGQIYLDSLNNFYNAFYIDSAVNIKANNTFIDSSDIFIMKIKLAFAHDAGIGKIVYPDKNLCPGKYGLKVQLRNDGYSDLTSVNIGWSVNGKTQTAYGWKGSISGDSSTTVTIGSYDFLSGKNKVKIWTYLPNGIKDSMPDNDTISFVQFIESLPTPQAGPNKTICFGSSVTLGTSANSGSRYYWTSNPSGFTDTTSNPTVTPKATITYYLTETNAAGCSKTDTVTVTVNSVPKAVFGTAKKLYCLSDTLSFTDSSVSASTYSWNFGDGNSASVQKPSHHYTNGGFYTVSLKVTNSSGCSDSVSHTVFIDSACVWPGDANHDKTVDAKDVLAIGVAYSDTGSKRPNASTNWIGQACYDWSKSFTSGSNYKHADCNGDGTADSLDMAAITLHYGYSHPKTEGTGDPNDPGLFLSSKDSVHNKDTLVVDINLGSAQKPVNNIYGLAFSISYDPSLINVSAPVKPDFSNCWIGTAGKDLLAFRYDHSKAGIMDIALCRTDHVNTGGYGKLGELRFVMPDTMASLKKLRLAITGIKAINFAQANVPLYTYADSVVVQQRTGLNESIQQQDQLRIYPNPANDQLQIESASGIIKEVRVTDMTGKLLFIQRTAAPKQVINVQNLAAGMYLLDIITDKTNLKSKFIKQ